MKQIDIHSHVRGESIFVDDIPVRERTLHAAVFASPSPHGNIMDLDTREAELTSGVTAVLTSKDIPGNNQVGIILDDEPLFAVDRVVFVGQPIALVLSENQRTARAALKKIDLEIDPLPAITDPREAFEKNEFIVPPRTFCLGDTEKAWKHCDHVIEGRAECGGQEHLYLETQSAYAYPTENGGVRIYSATQSPTVVQKTAALVLGIPMHKVEVDVPRIGGGFGGKESQATAWAVMAALGAFVIKRAVKLVLHRTEDMQMTGKRHPYSADFKIGLDKDYKIWAYGASFYQNAGAFADLSPAVMERTLFHATNSYFIPNVKTTVHSCRTNLPPNTALRGFGGPQGKFIMEAAIAKAAEDLDVEVNLIQRKNLLQEGDEFPFGQKASDCEAVKCWTEAETRYDVEKLRKDMVSFNAENKRYNKGISFMPICFGISFTKIHMNQAGALVHIYQDGSVGVSTGATEMGQGVNTKVVQVAAHTFSVLPSRIKIESTNTTRVANTSPTAASASADLNGKAVEKACKAILKRLLSFAAKELGHNDNVEQTTEIRDERIYDKGKKTKLTWDDLVIQAYLNRVNLSEHAHYATPTIYFDLEKEKGLPFAYHVYGTAITLATIDCLLGTYEIDAVKVVHESGKILNPIIDLGQVEGGIVQGIGWMTLEEISYDKGGRLLSNTLSNYKIPGIQTAPKTIDVHFQETESTSMAILRSKAVGEPPLMYGIGAYFAIRNALRAARPKKDIALSAPMTPEKVLMALYG